FKGAQSRALLGKREYKQKNLRQSCRKGINRLVGTPCHKFVPMTGVYCFAGGTHG
ncbi:hypothetical protein NDU88_002009, partial [Pleurodeles waltl]